MVKEEEERENHDESARLAMEVVKEEKEGKEEEEERVLANLICFVAQARAAVAEAFSSLKITTFLMTYGSHPCHYHCLDHTWPI